jgi:NAD(P)H-dependent FMN reductase
MGMDLDSKLFIPIILGTNRKGRQSEKVAKLIHGVMDKHPEIETECIDVCDFTLPPGDYGNGLKDQYPEYRDTIIRADSLVVVSPEYNHGYSGKLKSVMDLVLKPYIHKAVGLVGVSSGPWGGARGIEALVPMVRELGLVVTFADLYFPKVKDAFNDDGTPTDDGVYERIDGFLAELLWMSKSLRWGRVNIPSKHHEK